MELSHQVLYGEKKYAEIESYIKKETDEFSILCCRLYEELPQLLKKFGQS